MKNENEVKHTPTEFTCSTTEDLSGICEKCGNGLDMHDGDYKCLVQQKHTPTPWRHGDSPGDVCEIVGIETGKPYSSIIAETCGYKGQREANAAFIVRAVNSYHTRDMFLRAVSRLACLDQRNGDKCLCVSCEASRILSEAEGK